MAVAPDGTEFDLTGPPDARVVVMIHGLGLNRACWQWTIPALRDRHRILAYDMYGHGGSVAPPDTPDLSMFSRQLSGLLDHCGIEAATIVGFSLGGMIARRFAQDTPDRARALVILNSPHRRSEAAQAHILDRVGLAREIGPEATVQAAIERWFTPAFQSANPDVIRLVKSWVTANRQEVYHRIYRVLAEGVEEVVAPQPAITCPALIITGDQDFGNGPEMTQAIAAEIPGAEARILPGLRHMALAENPDAVNRPLSEFLDRLNPGA
tara:strand:+ start:1558 stop:2358 length:801 start_codon:yes stop_codon:yes gene_type:complete